jgi:hypothetical protein
MEDKLQPENYFQEGYWYRVASKLKDHDGNRNSANCVCAQVKSGRFKLIAIDDNHANRFCDEEIDYERVTVESFNKNTGYQVTLIPKPLIVFFGQS